VDIRVGAAEGCDLLTLKIKRSQPPAAPTLGLGEVSWGLVGCEAAIAGKPATTGGGGVLAGVG